MLQKKSSEILQKRIPSLCSLSYEERLAVLQLEPLEYRRLKFDLTMYFKIIHNLTPWPSNFYFNSAAPVRDTRLTAASSSSYYLIKPLCHTNLFQNDFFNRCINCWNSLPKEVVECNTVKLFKSSLSRVDLSAFLLYKFQSHCMFLTVSYVLMY